jgi:hypothetical protein
MIKLFGFANKDGKLMGRRELLASFELSEYDTLIFKKNTKITQLIYD